MPLFGVHRQKPRHYREMVKIAWENRDQLPFAWRILNDGVCDGCALGTSGLSDWTIKGTHLCMIRLELMRLNTAPALDPAELSDVASLQSLSAQQLRELGRLPEPMIRRRGERGFLVASWDEALDDIASKLRAVAKEYGPGETFPAGKDTTHWMENKGSVPAVLLVTTIAKKE
jgi:anaerobic selenocysteine-containing dehydrogenase